MYLKSKNTKELLSDPNCIKIFEILDEIDEIPFSELMTTINISKEKLNKYLSLLVDSNLILIKNRGKHRYYMLNTELKKTNLNPNVISRRNPKGTSIAKHLHSSRTCYNHLAGKLGVLITKFLINNGFLVEEKDKFAVTKVGEDFFRNFDIDYEKLKAKNKNKTFAGKCLDCSERRYHLSGSLGNAILIKMIELRWLEKKPARLVEITNEGEKGLNQVFRIKIEEIQC